MSETNSDLPTAGPSTETNPDLEASEDARMSPSGKTTSLPAIGTTLIIEINYSLVDAIVLAYSKGKKDVTAPPFTSSTVDSVRLKLLQLPISEHQKIDTETSMTVKYLKEVLRTHKGRSKGTAGQDEQSPEDAKDQEQEHQVEGEGPSTADVPERS